MSDEERDDVCVCKHISHIEIRVYSDVDVDQQEAATESTKPRLKEESSGERISTAERLAQARKYDELDVKSGFNRRADPTPIDAFLVNVHEVSA